MHFNHMPIQQGFFLRGGGAGRPPHAILRFRPLTKKFFLLIKYGWLYVFYIDMYLGKIIVKDEMMLKWLEREVQGVKNPQFKPFITKTRGKLRR